MLRALPPLTLSSALIVAVFLVGCRSDETIARENFGRTFTCPADRISLTPRKDLAAVDLAIRPQVPPKEIAADLARLELWKKEVARRAADYDGATVVQTRGCGNEVFYICGDLRVSVGATRHACMSAEYPPKPAAPAP